MVSEGTNVIGNTKFIHDTACYGMLRHATKKNPQRTPIGSRRGMLQHAAYRWGLLIMRQQRERPPCFTPPVVTGTIAELEP